MNLSADISSAIQPRLQRAETARERAAQKLSALIFYGLLAWLALSAVLYGTYQVWTEAAFACGVFGLTALACAEAALARSWRVPGGMFLLPLLALLGLMIVQAWTTNGQLGAGFAVTAKYSLSADFYETRRAALKLLALILIVVLLLRYTASPRRLRHLLFAVLLIGVGSALFGFVRLSSQTTDGFVLPFLRVKDKTAAQFINKNHYAFLLELTLGTALGLIAARGFRREKLLAFAVIPLLLWSSLMLTTSRGGILAFFCQLVFIVATFSFVHPRAAKNRQRQTRFSTVAPGAVGARLLLLIIGLAWRALAIVVLVAAVALGALWMGGDRMTERLQDKSEFAESTGVDAQAREQTNRLGIWRASWKMFRARPVIGHGFGAYWVAVPPFHAASGRLVPQQAHNDYLEILASGGIVGALCGLAFIVLFIKTAVPRLRCADALRRAAAYGALVGLTGVAVHSFFDFGLHLTVNAALAAALIALATVNGRAEENEQNSTAKLHAVRLPALSFGLGDYALAAVGIAACAALIFMTGKLGFARLFAVAGQQAANLATTETGVRYLPEDAETHIARGAVLWQLERRNEAAAEFEQATALRPADYILWLQLARALDFSGQETRAENALREAVRRAPYYSEPHWQLGQVLYRAGHYDEAFAEMRRASASNPLLYPNFVAFAWTQAANDPARLLQITAPHNELEHLTAGRFLVRNKFPAAAVAELQAAGAAADPDRRQLTIDFQDIRAYRLAFAFWSSGQTEELRRTLKIGTLIDGGFEQEFMPQAVFGWAAPANLARARVLRDGATPHTGVASARVDLTGYDDFANVPPLMQLVPVESSTRYRLTFAYRAQDITAAVTPHIVVADALGAPFAHSADLTATNGWQTVTLEFTTAEKTEAVRIAFTRGACPSSPCPTFGKFWFDSFQLQKL